LELQTDRCNTNLIVGICFVGIDELYASIAQHKKRMKSFSTKLRQVDGTLQRRTNAFVQSLPLQRAINTTFFGSPTFIIALFFNCSTKAQLPPNPQPNNFQPVIINNATRTATSLSRADGLSATDIYLKEQERQKQQKQEIEILKQEIDRYKTAQKQPPIPRPFRDTVQYNKDLAAFNTALQQLKTIQASKQSLADAFFVSESIMGKPYLSRAEYDKILDQSTDFIRKWMKANAYDMNSNEDKHLAIQKFMSEQLTIAETYTTKDGKTTFKTKIHQSFFYNYDDYQADKDHRNFFVTKCLATGGGQCSSMPKVYLLLAEKLNTPAYLSLAPQHSFIKYKTKDGEIENYEPTSNWHINNLWYQENLFISADAIRSGIYLDTLNKEKIIADCMLELATQYIRKMPNDDGKFIQDCLWEVHLHYPRHNNINAYFVYSTLLKGWLSKYIAQNNISDLEQIKADKWASDLQKEYQKNEAAIKALGYRDLPEGLYKQMLQEHEMKGNIQKEKNRTGKTKRNLFNETK
jgi:cell division septum initiation protein DivIVA